MVSRNVYVARERTVERKNFYTLLSYHWQVGFKKRRTEECFACGPTTRKTGNNREWEKNRKSREWENDRKFRRILYVEKNWLKREKTALHLRFLQFCFLSFFLFLSVSPLYTTIHGEFWLKELRAIWSPKFMNCQLLSNLLKPSVCD